MEGSLGRGASMLGNGGSARRGRHIGSRLVPNLSLLGSFCGC